ncbi:hypothetical protein RU97_GL000020 [Enterococcus canis]|uniref:N-acetyltransferase domain-containing protein n=1 Tax=Enterococcus canis TaxID=214095 RepID=A0A1L8RJ55_9ENTE|nr:GNAT family N-acetyltransferase [Enterococcus canis]OJG19787.1 hypothetical protein RU97_GL000020 [Enterococcus canis]
MKNKLQAIQTELAKIYEVEPTVFSSQEHHFIESDTRFFEMVTFGRGTAFFGEAPLLDKMKIFEGTPSSELMHGSILRKISDMLVEAGGVLTGENMHLIHPNPLGQIAQSYTKQGYYFRYFEEDITDLYEYSGLDYSLDRHHDQLAYAAFYRDELAAVAGANNQGKLWKVGVDTYEPYRGKGLGAYLVRSLTSEIERRGFLPFYSTWSSNIPSLKIGIGAGYTPGWVSYQGEKRK